MRQPLIKSIRSAFIAGIIVLSPLAVTIIVFTWLVGLIGGRYRDLLFFIPGDLLSRPQLEIVWNLTATVIILLLITLLGFLSRWVVARFFISQAERLMKRMPVISAVYSTAKQIVETFSARQAAVFQKVVLIEFPRPGCYALGFQTGTTRGEIQSRTEETVINIFVPTTPNPTSGFLVMLPQDAVRYLDMTVGEAMKVIISGGAVVPPWPPVTGPPPAPVVIAAETESAP